MQEDTITARNQRAATRTRLPKSIPVPSPAETALHLVRCAADVLHEAGEPLLLAPSSAELHGAFPEFARAELAERHSVPMEDLRLLVALLPLTDSSRDALVLHLRKLDAYFQDDSGRRWALDSAVRGGSRAALLKFIEESAPQYAGLDPDLWVPLAEAKRQLRGVARLTIEKRAPCVRPGSAVPGVTRSFVWLGPEVLERLSPPTLEEAVNRLGDRDLRAEDLLRRQDFFALAERRFGLQLRTRWDELLRNGRFTTVKAAPPAGTGPLQRYIHFPFHLCESFSEQEFRTWLFDSHENRGGGSE